MKKQSVKLKTAITLLLFLAAQFSVYSQDGVVIGDTGEPVKGALLEVRSNPAGSPASVTDADNVTSDQGGLGLPRVQLVNLKTLEPFIVLADDITKRKHAGLMVYNIYVSKDDAGNDESDPDRIFKQGIYVWDGEQWASIASGLNQKFFYMPAFNLPLLEVTGAGTKPTYDLYEEYARQFTKSGNSEFKSNSSSLAVIPSGPESGRLYRADELDYAVIYYDDNIVNVESIDTDGVMTYEVLDTDPGPFSFMNIIFIVKE